jgi:hypothetical protein
MEDYSTQGVRGPASEVIANPAGECFLRKGDPVRRFDTMNGMPSEDKMGLMALGQVAFSRLTL